MRKLPTAMLGIFLLMSSSLVAGDEVAAFRERLKKILPPSAVLSDVAQTPVPGVYEVTIGNRTVYAYGSGDFLLVGEMFDLVRDVNLAEEKHAEQLSEAIAGMPTDKMIVIGPDNAKRYVTVFTDVDCGYCRRLHRDVPALNAAGLEIRYLMFPRAGLGSKSYDTSVSVWCAEDQVDAITRAKLGQAIESRTCENPVAEHYRLGQQVGVAGTPTIILDNGRIVPGYLPPQTLLSQVGLSQ